MHGVNNVRCTITVYSMYIIKFLPMFYVGPVSLNEKTKYIASEKLESANYGCKNETITKQTSELICVRMNPLSFKGKINYFTRMLRWV
jgi:hypothetical protein